MKGLLMTVLFLLLTVLPAQAGGLDWLDLGEGEGVIVSDSGEMLTRPGEYSYMYRLTSPDVPGDVLYAACEQESGLLLLMNDQGKALTGAEYDALQYGEECILFGMQERFGVMDLSGKVLLDAQYTWMTAIDGEHFFAYKSDHWDDTADTLYLVGLTEGETDLGMRIAFGPYSGMEGLFAAFDPVRQCYGFLDRNGQWAIEPQYVWVNGFEGSCALAGNGEGIGLIDTQGRWVVAPIYGSLQFCGSGNRFLVGQYSDGLRLLSAADYRVVREYPHGSEAVGPDGWCALYLEDGIVILNPEGEEACTLSNDQTNVIDLYQGGGYMVLYSGIWGTKKQWVCTLEGEKLLGPYQEVSYLGPVDGKDCFLVSEFECTYVQFDDPAFNYYAETEGTRRCGMVDAQGNEVLPMEYEHIVRLENGLIAARKDGEYQFIQTD